MALTTEEQQLVMKVMNTADVERLNAVLAAETKTVVELEEAKKRGLITDAAYERQIKRTTESLSANQLEHARLQTALKQANASVKGWNQALVQVGYTVDDLQYGFKGIANNIQPVLMSIPGVGAWAAGIAIASTATYQLYTHWESLANTFEQKVKIPTVTANVAAMKRELEEANKKLKEMEAQGSLTAAQLAKYNTLRARTAELEKTIADQMERQKNTKDALESKTKEKQERVDYVKESLQGKGQAFQDSIEKALMSPVERENLAKAEARRADLHKFADANYTPEAAARQKDQADREYDKKTRNIRKGRTEQAKTVFDRFANADGGSTEQVNAMMQEHPELFDKDVAKKLRDNDPAAVAERKRIEAGNAEQAKKLAELQSAFNTAKAKILAEVGPQLKQLALEGLAGGKEDAAGHAMRNQATQAGARLGLDGAVAKDVAFALTQEAQLEARKTAAGPPKPGQLAAATPDAQKMALAAAGKGVKDAAAIPGIRGKVERAKARRKLDDAQAGAKKAASDNAAEAKRDAGKTGENRKRRGWRAPLVARDPARRAEQQRREAEAAEAKRDAPLRQAAQEQIRAQQAAQAMPQAAAPQGGGGLAQQFAEYFQWSQREIGQLAAQNRELGTVLGAATRTLQAQGMNMQGGWAAQRVQSYGRNK